VSARYLVRFDDICPTMDWAIWGRIEALLGQLGIQPIMAIVPDNRDPMLEVAPAVDDFWERVRRWQAAGWFIALHGYQHQYVTKDPGLVGLNPFSEFAGLPIETQKRKLGYAMEVFRRNGVRADGWVAPAHSFDQATVRALLEVGIDVISDGFFRRPVRHLGATWIPQQIWRFRPMPAGVWTVCLHPNSLGEPGFEALRHNLARYAAKITSPAAVLREQPVPPCGLADLALMRAWRGALRLKRVLS